MWEWVIWQVYWLCWIETGHMWISILWTLCGLFYWNVLCHCAVQREDTLKNSSHYHNGSRLYYGYTSWWIHCTMNCPDQCCNQATTVTLTSLISIFFKWTVQCVHLHFNSDSKGLNSDDRIAGIEISNRIQKIIIPHIFDPLLRHTHKLHCLKMVCVNFLNI